MSDLIILGNPQSTYVRTARMACAEKGVAYTLDGIEMKSPEHLALNPFGRVPVMRHGDVTLYESAAIARYVDTNFDGPPLVPTDPVAGAHCEQWVSITLDMLNPTIIRSLVLPEFGLIESTEEKKAEAAKGAEKQLGVLDDVLGERSWLAGERPSLAECFVGPVLFWLWVIPAGQAMQGKHANISRWYEALAERPSFKSTIPPMPGS